MFDPGFVLSERSALIWPPPGRHLDLSCCSGRHFDLSCCSGTTFRPILLLHDDSSTYPDAPGRHFELWDDMSTYPAALGRHFDISCCFGATFRPILLLWAKIRAILLLWEDISAYPANLGHSNALTLLGTFLRCHLSTQTEICDEVHDRVCDRYMHANPTYRKPH